MLAALIHNPIQASGTAVPPGKNVTLAWSQSTDPAVAGYNVYYGQSTSSLTNEVTAGTATNVTIPGFMPGTTYYFAATTYDSSGAQSALSSEVTYTVPMPILAVSIAAAVAGQFVLNVTGTAGQTYTIQATQDLKTWTAIGTVTVGAGGTANFTDTTATGLTSRFYRMAE